MLSTNGGRSHPSRILVNSLLAGDGTLEQIQPPRGLPAGAQGHSVCVRMSCTAGTQNWIPPFHAPTYARVVLRPGVMGPIWKIQHLSPGMEAAGCIGAWVLSAGSPGPSFLLQPHEELASEGPELIPSSGV